MISQKIGSLFRSLMSPAEEISHGDEKSVVCWNLAGNRRPRHGQRHDAIVVLPGRRTVADQSGRQPFTLISYQFVHQHWIVEDSDITALERQGERLDRLGLARIRRRERQDAHAVSGELLDHRLPDTVLLGDDQSGVPVII